jgi:hypothetical protein
LQKVIFNKSNDFCVGIDREVLPFEYFVQLPYPISCSKTIQEKTSNQIQATNNQNQPLYKTNIKTNPITGEETYDSTTYDKTVLTYQTVTNTYKVADPIKTTSETITNPDGTTSTIQVPVMNTITTTSQIPDQTIENPPIMIPEIINKTYQFEENPYIFSYDEILTAKKSAINNNSLTKLFFYDEDFLNNDLVFNQSHIGDGFISITPQGSVSTQTLTLPKQTNIIELYQESQEGLLFEINDIQVVDGRVKLSSLTNQIIIKVSNPTNKNLELYALGGMC